MAPDELSCAVGECRRASGDGLTLEMADQVVRERLSAVREEHGGERRVGGFIVGFLASAVTGWLAVWGTLKFVRTRSFAPFVGYRVVVGLAVLGLLATNFR